LKPYGLATEKIDGEHYRVVDTTKSLLDKSTGNQMHPQVMKMTLTAARNANGEPTEKLGLAVDHRDGSTGDPVDRVYIKNILDSLIELYSTGARP
jgi:hypothetical protein